MTTTHWKPVAIDLETVSCPLCNYNEFTVLARTDRYDMDLITAGCNSCGLVMINPQPNTPTLDEFYRQHYRRYYQKTDVPSLEYIRNYRKDERAAHAVKFLSQMNLIRAGARVLDIGASEGCMLRAIADAMPNTQRVAVEPNPEFGAFAASHADCSLHASVEDLMLQASAAFDLIVINHVYEHVKQPIGFLAKLAELLAPGGHIYIDVPDITEYNSLDSLHIAHLYHFGPDTLRRTAERAGYGVVFMGKHQPIMHPRSLRCILRVDNSVTAAAPVNLHEGWALVAKAEQQAWRYHRKRWSIGRRLKHLLMSHRSPSLPRQK